MAEVVASKLAQAVVSQAVRTITDLLVREATSLSSVKDDVECFLKDAESKQQQDERVRNWVAEVKDVACEIEDAIETYIFKVNSSQRYQIEFSSGEGIDTTALKNLRRSYPDDDDDDDDNHSDDVITLKAQLVKEEDRCCVVSIVGMGGLGKTTLAKKAYNDIDLKKHFDCRAWVFVSQQFVPKDILSELEKRYLIILADIWHIQAWYSIQGAFLTGKTGSKVVFTTRIKEVAFSVGPNNSSQIQPPLLTPAESWELLKRKAFQRETFGKHACPPQFEVIGKEIIQNCGGLPLAIVVLGGLLRNKTHSVHAWEKVQKDAKSHINKLKSEQQYRVDDILDLSFQDLPYYLKPCFLYLGSFPEDSKIPKSMLIRLWMAEGFISTMEREDIGGELIENVAEQYLGELVDRCMVQVDKRDHTGKGVKTCRLHDLMRDFCISKAKAENFLDIMQKHNVNMMTAGSSSVQFHPVTRFRRIAIHVNDHDLHHHTPNWMEQVGPNIRSLLCFGIDTLPIVSVTKNFILLRVLKLDFNWTKFPTNKSLRGIGNLIHLRYLRLSGASDESKLPRSIGNLQNFFEEFAVLEKLPNLRILRLDNDLVDETSRNSVYKLVCSANGFPKLEVLTLRSLYRLEEWEVEEGATPNLRRLNMIGLQTLKAIPEGLKYVSTLCELHVVAMWRDFEDNVRVNEGVEGKDFYKVRHIPFISYSR
ncbi:LOW QUALITY PROTEIN: disease resistance protein RPH8A [Morus notabilis]|uniref:LOW QUALITY PROTEIN: disease resistance protein RPH8A n=1 Tax=Morus notabilis TaxID=981085 RepID=UPI000CED6FFE|nr:LOW QUALITY PROTEIN: disease resistance protein RPH8A [Morus notabilis]